MKPYALILVIMFTLASISLRAQVKVTGHVSAEVVESVSLNNELNHTINIERSQMNNVDLGSIKVSGLSNTAFNVSVENTLLYNSTDSFSFDTNLKQQDYLSGNSSHDISLSAIIDKQAQNGDYDGRLTVIVSYN